MSDSSEVGAGAAGAAADIIMGAREIFGEHMGGGGIICEGNLMVDDCTGCAYVAAGKTCTAAGLTGVGPAVLNVPTATCGVTAGAPRRPSRAAADPCEPPCNVPRAVPG